MGEFSMQLFYLFVYVLVVCESVPVVTEGAQGDDVYNAASSRRDGHHTARTDMSTTPSQAAHSQHTQLHATTDAQYLYNISKGFVEKLQLFTETLLNFLRSSIMAKSTHADDDKSVVINGNSTDMKNSDIKNKTHKGVAERTHIVDDSSDNNSDANSEQFTSTTPSLAGYTTSESTDRSKAGQLLPAHRKYRQKRSFFIDYGLGLSSALEEDGLDVIFGAHTSPCARSHRHYCLNGGTCVYLEALDIKTCRCPVGYTGLRCEMLNQEYILALLSEEFFG